MRADRWQEMQRLLQAALDQPLSERAAFVAGACGDDGELRRELESLVRAEEDAGSFLDLDFQSRAWTERRLAPGSCVGPYEIQSALGAGGFSEVYKARDTRLDRLVAIKIIPDGFDHDPERLARFTREARLLAALNHPHIAAIYDLDEVNGSQCIVMELVDGETLAARLLAGALALADALDIARQVAGALQAAHEKGIIHRDLKPANIALTDEGRVKVLDFGLAKALDPAADGDATHSPAVDPAASHAGLILGTAAYMAPEQAKGRAADKHSDVWAFGCVLYEMLAGKRAFEGEDVGDTLAAVLRAEPDWVALPDSLPPSVRQLLRHCLDKDPKRRLHDIGAARLEIEEALRAPATGVPGTMGEPPARNSRHPVPLALTLALALAAAAAGAVATRVVMRRFESRSSTTTSGVTRTLVSVAPADQLRANSPVENLTEGRPSRTAMVVSPDGRSLVFSAIRGNTQQLFRRELDQLDATPIAGTEGGASPFFSPDGRWVGFWAHDALKKVPLTGGAGAVTICQTIRIFGASWGSNGTIVFAHGLQGLWQVPAAGGEPQQLTRLDEAKNEVSHRLPQVLPGNEAVLFTVTQSIFPKWEETHVWVQSLATRERKELVQGSDARYVPTGHLVYMHAGDLLAVPFDLRRLTVTSGPVNVIPQVMQAAYNPNIDNDTGAGQFDVSPSGALVYIPGGMSPELERSLVWVDRTGATQPLAAPMRAYYAPRLSPDGQRALVWTSGRDRNVWVYDIRRGTLTPVTREGRNSYSLWTPDGKRVAFTAAATPDNPAGIYWKSADGTGMAERLTTTNGIPCSWSPDGQTLAFSTPDGGIWALPLNGDRRPRTVVRTRFTEWRAEFSPDGRWLAYESDESGRSEVYAQPYPGPGPRQQMSIDGGEAPAWSRDGRELFYQVRGTGAAADLMQYVAVPVTLHPTLTAGTPKVLFQRQTPLTSLGVRYYDVSPDGPRFLLVQDKERPPIKVTQMILFQNWLEELKRLVPTK